MKSLRAVTRAVTVLATATATLALPSACDLFPSFDPYVGNGDAALAADVVGAETEVPDSSSCEAGRLDDPKRCGVCGRDCAGGACVAGVCQPFLFEGVADDPIGVFADDIGVVLATRASSGGGGAVRFLSHDHVTVKLLSDGASAKDPRNVTALGGTAYWVNAGARNGPTSGYHVPGSGSIFAAKLDGGSPTAVVTGLTDPFDIAVALTASNAVGLVFSVRGTSCDDIADKCGEFGEGAIRRVTDLAARGDAGASTEALAENEVAPRRVLLAGGSGAPLDGPIIFNVDRAGTKQAAPIRIARAAGAAADLVSNARAADVARATDGTIAATSTVPNAGVVLYDASGGQIRSFAVTLQSPGGIVADATTIFAVDVGVGVVRIDRATGTVTTLSGTSGASGAIAQTNTFVYFASMGTSGAKGFVRLTK